MPVRPSATTSASLNGCGGPWWDVSGRALHLVEDILSTYCKCTFWGMTHKVKCFWTYVDMEMFSCFGMWNSCPNFVRNFQLHSVCACGLLQFRSNLETTSLSVFLQGSVNMGSGHRKAPILTQVSARRKNADVHPCSRSVLNSRSQCSKGRRPSGYCAIPSPHAYSIVSILLRIFVKCIPIPILASVHGPEAFVMCPCL
jgi:hypothetical protein